MPNHPSPAIYSNASPSPPGRLGLVRRLLPQQHHQQTLTAEGSGQRIYHSLNQSAAGVSNDNDNNSFALNASVQQQQQLHLNTTSGLYTTINNNDGVVATNAANFTANWLAAASSLASPVSGGAYYLLGASPAASSDCSASSATSAAFLTAAAAFALSGTRSPTAHFSPSSALPPPSTTSSLHMATSGAGIGASLQPMHLFSTANPSTMIGDVTNAFGATTGVISSTTAGGGGQSTPIINRTQAPQ